jgi:small subunit ribosomal protein S4
MGKNIGPKNRIARRFGMHLGLKTNATKVARRIKQAPGVHGPKNKKSATSSFGRQLIEKQKAKLIYGIRERQFRGYVEEASRVKGDSGMTLHRLLESRLDNVIYRMGFAVTRAQARQFVNHGLFIVNGKKMNIPSYSVQSSDEIAIRDNKKNKTLFAAMTDALTKHVAPGWVAVDPVKKTGKVLHMPEEQDFEKLFDVKLIIEYYSQR